MFLNIYGMCFCYSFFFFFFVFVDYVIKFQYSKHSLLNSSTFILCATFFVCFDLYWDFFVVVVVVVVVLSYKIIKTPCDIP